MVSFKDISSEKWSKICHEIDKMAKILLIGVMTVYQATQWSKFWYYLDNWQSDEVNEGNNAGEIKNLRDGWQWQSLSNFGH